MDPVPAPLQLRDPPAGRPGVVLSDRDYRPLAGYPFQRWGERTGRPWHDVRPLTADAARRVWRRALLLMGIEFDGPLPADRFPRQDALDLRDPASPWDESTVRDWLLARSVDPGAPVLACYGPEWAVEVAWADFCDFWLTFLWVDACAFPASEAWFVRSSGERFVAGRRD